MTLYKQSFQISVFVQTGCSSISVHKYFRLLLSTQKSICDTTIKAYNSFNEFWQSSFRLSRSALHTEPVVKKHDSNSIFLGDQNQLKNSVIAYLTSANLTDFTRYSRSSGEQGFDSIVISQSKRLTLSAGSSA